MRHQVNPFFAILIITIFGSWAAFTIVDVATSDIFSQLLVGSEAAYAPLQQSILNH